MKKLSVIIAVLLVSSICIALLLIAIGFRINTTDSIPLGLYRISSIKNLKNFFIIFCPEDRPAFRLALQRGYISSGLCPGGYGYLMKKVVAIKGDKVSVTPKGIFVNRMLIPYSNPKLKDGMNRTLPQWQPLDYQLEEDEVVTMTSQSEWSFDARYYGPVHIGQIIGEIIPIWVKNNSEQS